MEVCSSMAAAAALVALQGERESERAGWMRSERVRPLVH